MTFSISLEESRNFARLSGDWNPIHIDPVAARRTLYGKTVVHGIHLLLASLETCPAEKEITGIKTSFRKPVFHDQQIRLEGDGASSGQAKKICAWQGTEEVLRIQLSYGTTSEGPGPLESGCWKESAPEEPNIQTALDTSGNAILSLDETLSNFLFPTLCQSVPKHLLAGLLAATRVVGMNVPGQNSLLLNVQFALSPEEKGPLQWRVIYVSGGGVALIAFSGMGLKGTVEAMFRPKPVEQLSYAQAKEKYTTRAFSGRRALVLGGSRGLGEVAAKLLAVGGAEVLIGYNLGAQEAEMLAREITIGLGKADCLKIDVTSLPAACPQALQGRQITDLLYFPTPFIVPSLPGSWNVQEFDRHSAVHVKGLAATVEALADKWKCASQPLSIFYPSTCFLDTGSLLAAEYTAAKAAGEILCRNLAQNPCFRPGVFRLPQLKTDQTQMLGDLEDKAEDVLYDLLRRHVTASKG